MKIKSTLENSKLSLTWSEYDQLVCQLSDRIKKSNVNFKMILAIGRGGLPIGVMLSNKLNIRFAAVMINRYDSKNKAGKANIGNLMFHKGIEELEYPLLVCDDLVDEGLTMKELLSQIDNSQYNVKSGKLFTATLFMKPWSVHKPNFYLHETTDWVKFPYEEEYSHKVTDIELGWLAGMIDGEGSISLEKSSNSETFTPSVSVCSTTKNAMIVTNRILRKLKIRATIDSMKSNKPNSKDAYQITIASHSKVMKLLNYIENYLVIKKRKAEIVREYCQSRIKTYRVKADSRISKHEKELALSLKYLNKRGIRNDSNC